MTTSKEKTTGNEVTERAKDGTFLPGSSGNLNGRPLGRKNKLTQMKQDLEIAVRDHLQPRRIRSIINKMCEEAENGSVGAAKLILDKVLSNARDGEDAAESSGTFVFQVKNLTLKHDDENPIIDITPDKEGHDEHRRQTPEPESD